MLLDTILWRGAPELLPVTRAPRYARNTMTGPQHGARLSHQSFYAVIERESAIGT